MKVTLNIPDDFDENYSFKIIGTINKRRFICETDNELNERTKNMHINHLDFFEEYKIIIQRDFIKGAYLFFKKEWERQKGLVK